MIHESTLYGFLPAALQIRLLGHVTILFIHDSWYRDVVFNFRSVSLKITSTQPHHSCGTLLPSVATAWPIRLCSFSYVKSQMPEISVPSIMADRTTVTLHKIHYRFLTAVMQYFIYLSRSYNGGRSKIYTLDSTGKANRS